MSNQLIIKTIERWSIMSLYALTDEEKEEYKEMIQWTIKDVSKHDLNFANYLKVHVYKMTGEKI